MRISSLAASRAFTAISKRGLTRGNDNYGAAIGTMIHMRMMSDMAAPSAKVSMTTVIMIITEDYM